MYELPIEQHAFSLAELTDLSDHAWTARMMAVHLLALDGAEKHLAPLFSALSDREYKVSWTAKLKLTEVVSLIPLARLLDALQHPAHWVRRHALELLAKHHKRPALEPLLTVLHDDNASVREAAVTAFANWTEDAPLEELVEATYDDDAEVRLAAAVTLGKVGLRNPALAQVGILNTLLQPGINDPDRVGMIATALRGNSPHAPSEPLLHAMYELYSRSNNWLASITAEALTTQGERMPVAELRDALYDMDRGKRWLACLALRGAGASAPIQELIELLDSPENDHIIEALSALWEHVPSTVFLRILRDEKSREHGGVQSLAALLRKGESIPEDILSWALTTFYFEDQQMLAGYLASLEELPPLPHDVLLTGLAKAILCAPADYHRINKAAIKMLVPRFPLVALQKMLQHQDVRVRRGALLLLAHHPEELPQEALVAFLNDPFPDDLRSLARRTALACLRVHSDPIPVQSLLTFLHNPALCCDVLRTLGKAGENAPLPETMPFLNSTNFLFRASALRALSQPGLLERTSIETFLNAAGDTAVGVRKEALKALKKKDRQLAIECSLLELGNNLFNQVAFQILQEIHPAIIPEIMQEATKLLQGGRPSRFFRSLSMSFLADAIGNMGCATPELIARLGEMLDWPYWEVRMKAVQALGKLRRNIPDATLRRLLELRSDPHSRAVCEAAEEALAEILSQEAGIEDD